MPHQMSWRYDTLTLMFNKAHLLQNLEASHIPPRLFYYYDFFLGLPVLRFQEGNSSALFLRMKLTMGTSCIFSYLHSPTRLINHTWACNYLSTFLWRVIQSILASYSSIKDILGKHIYILPLLLCFGIHRAYFLLQRMMCGSRSA